MTRHTRIRTHKATCQLWGHISHRDLHTALSARSLRLRSLSTVSDRSTPPTSTVSAGAPLHAFSSTHAAWVNKGCAARLSRSPARAQRPKSASRSCQTHAYLLAPALRARLRDSSPASRTSQWWLAVADHHASPLPAAANSHGLRAWSRREAVAPRSELSLRPVRAGPGAALPP